MAYSLQISRYEISLATRYIIKQTGLLLTEHQLIGLWTRTGLGGILQELGRVDRWICIDLVDALCREVLGHDWPINGDEGEEKAFFHRFTIAAIEAGYALDYHAVAA